MRTVLMLSLALLLGCEPPIEEAAQPLTVYPISGLPSYDEGRILHPYHTSKPDRDRFPLAPIVAAASDPACVLGDDSFVKCRMYDCEAAPCTSGTCTDVTVMYDPNGSPPPIVDWHGIPVVYLPGGGYYQPLHQATCLL